MQKGRNYIIAVLFFVLLVPFVQAQQVRNSIKIENNTGGNTVNGRTDGAEVTTGDTTTSINIHNNSQQSEQVESTDQVTTQSRTNIDIKTTGNGTNQVEVSLNNTHYSVKKENGQTVVVTTDSEGKTTERTLEEGETLRVGFEDNTQISITSDENGFLLTQNQSLVQTQLPLSVDLESESVVVQVEGESVSLELLPESMEQLIIDQGILDSRTSDFSLVYDNDKLQYLIEGQKQKKLLGLVPVNIHKKVWIEASTDTAAMTQRIEQPFHRLLNWLSV